MVQGLQVISSMVSSQQDWPGLVTVRAAAGMLLGARLSHRSSPERLRKGFAIFTILAAVFLVVKNYSVLL